MPQRSVASPIGSILLRGEGRVLHSVRIGEASTDGATGDALLDEAAAQLDAYFAGKLEAFDLPLAPPSTERGMALRAAMCAIPFGATLTYGDLARTAGSSPRAIGQACARNPFPIIVPCHRVRPSTGADHYSGGAGVPTKRWLLHHEGTDLWAT